jgi:hypothetical protein
MDLKEAGLSLNEATDRLARLLRIAGGQTPETARLDTDIIGHCIEQFNRPSSPRPPKPPEYLG